MSPPLWLVCNQSYSNPKICVSTPKCKALSADVEIDQAMVQSILGKLRLPEAADDHRRVLAVITYLEAR